MSDRPEFVLVGGKAYPVEAYHAALNTALLARLEAVLPSGSSMRRAFRTVRALKTPDAHRAVMNHTLRLLAESDADVSLEEALEQAEALPIAAFPKRIDNPNARD